MAADAVCSRPLPCVETSSCIRRRQCRGLRRGFLPTGRPRHHPRRSTAKLFKTSAAGAPVHDTCPPTSAPGGGGAAGWRGSSQRLHTAAACSRSKRRGAGSRNGARAFAGSRLKASASGAAAFTESGAEQAGSAGEACTHLARTTWHAGTAPEHLHPSRAVVGLLHRHLLSVYGERCTEQAAGRHQSICREVPWRSMHPSRAVVVNIARFLLRRRLLSVYGERRPPPPSPHSA